MTKWVCWNYESGFYIIDEATKDDAALRCEMDQPIGMEAVLLGEEEEVKENMWALIGEKRTLVIQAKAPIQARSWEKQIKKEFPLLPVRRV